MKHIFVLLGAATCAIANAQAPLPSQRLAELRIAIQQSQIPAPTRPTAAAPRQLSAEERAELRRQVQQQSRRPAK